MIGAAINIATVDMMARTPSPFGSGGGVSGSEGVMYTGVPGLGGGVGGGCTGLKLFGSISGTNYTLIQNYWI